MNIESQIILNRLKLRPFQEDLFRAIENKGYKKALCIWPRRSGKDYAVWNFCIREALRKVGVIFYIFPTYAQARRAIWSSITSDGRTFLSMIPPDLIARKNEQEMKITFINGSILQLCGSTDYDRLRGTNCRLALFSEYAYQDPTAYQVIRPILLGNGGTAIFVSTVNGKNHLWELYNVAKDNPEWYCSKLSIEDTQHIEVEDIEREIAAGEISRDMARQEYWNDFDTGVEGSYYAKYLDKMRLNNQIGSVPWEPSFKVHTAWDLGMRDSTSIIFFQVVGQTVRIIDYFEDKDKGLESYSAYLQSKPYQYGSHFAPHDIAVRELGTGLSRLEKARQLGISFQIAPNLSIADGIEAVRTSLAKIWIDEKKCKRVVDTLQNYRKEWDNKRKVYNEKPLHDQWSHCADCLRMLCLSLPKTKDGMSAEDLSRIRHEALYGTQHFGPSPFSNNKPYY